MGFAGTAIAANVPLMHPEMAEVILQLNFHDSEDTIAEKLNRWLSDAALLELFSHKAQKYAMNNFRCSRKVDEMLEAYAHYRKGSRGLLHATQIVTEESTRKANARGWPTWPTLK